MFELIFGGLLRLLPEAGRLWERSNERKHEREMLKLQFELDAKRAELELHKTTVDAELKQQIAELQALIEATKAQGHTFAKTGHEKLDRVLVYVEAISSTVRPVLTYWYCVAAYGVYKLAVLVGLMKGSLSWDSAIVVLWTSVDTSIVLSILGFWFVDRALRKQQAR